MASDKLGWIVAGVLALSVVPARAPGAPSRAAEDRGRLSLAWDAHDAGLCEEALSYLDEIPAGSSLAADALWLRAECLYDLGRYAQAAGVLESRAAASLADRTEFLLDVYWSWTGAELLGGRPDRAEAVSRRALGVLPDEPEAWALDAVVAFRAAAARALGRAPAGSPPPGVELRVLPPGETPEGPGWVRAHPWSPSGPWVPEVTWDEWLPGDLLARTTRKGVVWVRVPVRGVLAGVTRGAVRAGLSARAEKGWAVLGLGDEEAWVDLREWAYRGAVEGLGVEGAALLAVARAAGDLRRRGELVAWVRTHADPLEVERVGPVLRLRHPRTGRTFDLDPAAWAGRFSADGASWSSFWGDLRAELGRPARPFRCFCGRPAVLREVLVSDPGEALVWEKAGSFQVVVAALCPDHIRYVTADVVREWGVGLRAVMERVRADARTAEWDLSFQRGEAGGAPVIVLEGEGAASLVRWPGLLLGALEAVEGQRARGRSVRVLAPSASTLLVLPGDAGPAQEEEALRWGLRVGERWGGAPERIDYRARVRLPAVSEGRFRVSPVE